MRPIGVIMSIRNLRRWSRLGAIAPFFALALLVPQNGPAARAASGPSTNVIVQALHGESSTARRSIGAAGGRIVHEWRLISGFEVELPADHLARLRQSAGIRAVLPNAPVYTTSDNNGGPGPSANDLYNQALNVAGASASGDTGQGVGVALVDTGVTRVRALNRANIVQVNVDPTISPNDVNDYYGHGTFLAGVIVGNHLGAALEAWRRARRLSASRLPTTPDEAAGRRTDRDSVGDRPPAAVQHSGHESVPE